jgi:hypothetical protein
MVALSGDTHILAGEAAMQAGALIPAAANTFDMVTSAAVSIFDATLTAVIAASATLSVMVSRTMITMGTMVGDAVGYTAGRLSPGAPIGGTAITPASIIVSRP